MKALLALLVILAVIFVLPVTCSGRGKMQASSLRSAYKSARLMKNYIHDDAKSLEFQIAFGTLQKIKTEEGGTEAFLDSIDGKKADEIIAMARDEVNKHISQGDKQFAKYKSWDDMVQQLTKDTPKVLGREREQRAFD